MIPCPNCQQSVEILDKHLGTLFTCPHCSAVYFIDWNGQPEMAQPEPEQEQEPQQEAELGPYGQLQESPNFFEPPPSNEAEQNFGLEQEPVYDQAFEQPMESPSEAGTESEPQPQPELESAAEPEAEAPYDFGQTLDAPIAQDFGGTSDTPDFSDVTDFANSNTSSGPISYTVVIEGVESSRLLAQLKEAMTDSRFGWDVESVLTNLGGGRIVLNALSPAKASVLINRIKYLPLKISWRQDVLSGS